MSSVNDEAFDALGLPPPRNNIVTVRFLGKVRRWSGLAAYEKILLVLVNFSLVGALGFTLYVIHAYENPSDRTYAVLVAFNIAVCFIYIWKGVLQENPSTMVIFVLSAAVLCSYVIGNFASLQLNFDGPMVVKLCRLVLLLGALLVIVPLSIKAAYNYYVSKNLICRTVSTNVSIQSACLALHVAQSLLLLDYQLAESLIILEFNPQAIGNASDEKALPISIVTVGTVFSFAWLFLGYFAMPQERPKCMYVFWFLSLLSPAFLIYLVYCIASNGLPTASNDRSSNNDQNFINIATFICASFGIVTRILVVLQSIRVYRNFGRGLKHSGAVSDESRVPITYAS